MNPLVFSKRYRVRRMGRGDVTDVYLLCRENGLYYQYCPPFVTEQGILDDMGALPPGKGMEDKYYIGYYRGEELVAVMDLIMAYPDGETAFIGFL